MPRHIAGEKPSWTVEDAEEIGTAIGIEWESARFEPEAFLEGLVVELEHGTADERTDVTGDDPDLTGKIAWAHLLEDPDYYVVLKEVEKRVKQQEREAYVPEPFLPIADLEQTLSALTKKYASLTQHREVILRRASALAVTIAELEPSQELLSDEHALRGLAENAATAAEHLDNLASGVPALREHRQTIATVRTALVRQKA